MTEFSQDVYVAMGRLLLYGEAPTDALKQALPTLLNQAIEASLKLVAPGRGEDETEVGSLFFVGGMLGLWYMARQQILAGKVASDSEAAKAATNLRNAILSLVLTPMAECVDSGDAAGLRRFAMVIENAQRLDDFCDAAKQEAWLNRLRQGFGLPKAKTQRQTQRLRALLPLWQLGFGGLSDTEKNEVFDKIGLSLDEIPEADALRKMLSYFRSPRRGRKRTAKNPMRQRSARA